jgi:hypothetical protein
MRTLALGIDNAMQATGLCLVEWHPVAGAKPLYWTTVKNQTVPKVNQAIFVIAGIAGLDNIELIALEDGFFSPYTPGGFGEVERSGGMWEQACLTNWKTARLTRMMANVWRPRYLGKGPWSRENAEAAAIQLAIAHGIPDPTVHEAEALGIVSTSCKAHLNTEESI